MSTLRSPTIVDLLVYGYIRSEIESNKSWTLTIPAPIKDLCTKYHGFVFTESNILNNSQQLALWKLLSQKVKFHQTELLYNALRDGFTEDGFYKNIEGKAPTIIIAHTNYGNIYGVFTTVNWQKGAARSTDPYAFVWLLRSDKGDDVKPQIFASNTRSMEVFQSGQTGGGTICFECPAAFSFNDNCNIKESNVAYKNDAYGITDGSLLCGGNKQATYEEGYAFGCVDVEIFEISQPYEFK